MLTCLTLKLTKNLTLLLQQGYLDDNLRLKAIEEYEYWVDNIAVSMTMKLNEVRGKIDIS